MPSRYAEAAPFASLLGALFYADPADAAAERALAFLASEDAAEQWLYGGEEARRCVAAMARALAADGAEASEGGESIHEAFARLFVGPNKLPAPPWGSVYTDHDSVIFGNKTLDVRAWMRDNGVKMELGSYVPEDHIGLLLIMFSWAVRNGVPDEKLTELLEEHLLSWSDRFLELFVEGAVHPFYENLGGLARATLADWTERFALDPARPRMYR